MYILSISIYVLPSPGRSLPPLCRGLLDIFGAALEAELGGELFDFPIDFPSKCWGWCIVPNQQPDLLLYHVV